MLRVNTIEEIFAAVETLARAPKFPGDRLSVVTNGGGIGVMAADRLAELGGRLAEFSDETKAALDKLLPDTWSHGNPADIIGDAPPERYAGTLRTLIAAKESDAVLVMHAPTASSTEAAQAVIDVAHETKAPILANWVVSLPPLNMHLARDMISRTRIWRLLQGYRDRPPVDLDALCLTLVQISQMVVDIPEIAELDINPLLADENGVLALDARIRVASPSADQSRELAIRPYPQELEEPFTLKDGTKVLLRPIRPEDEPEHREFISRLTPEDIRFRFFGLVREFPHSEIARLTQIDFDREMTFIASVEKPGPDGTMGRETLGVVRTVTDPDNETCEFAVIVRSDLKGQGHKLMEKMVAYCRARGTKTMVGQMKSENHPMLDMVRNLGFHVRRLPDEPVMETTLNLGTPPT